MMRFRFYFFLLLSIAFIGIFSTPFLANAYTDLECKQTIQGEHPTYRGITKTFTGVTLCTYMTGYTGNLSTIAVDKEQGVALPVNASAVTDVYLYFSGKGGGSPEDNCVGASQLCAYAEQRGNIAIVFFNRQDGKNGMLRTADSMRFFVQEAKQVLQSLGVNATRYHLAGHSAGGEQVAFAAQFLPDMQFGYSLVFDGCYGTWCDELVRYPNRGFSILYLNGGELTTAQSAIQTSPTNIRVLDIPGVTHDLVPFRCFGDHVTHDSCGVSATTVYEQGSAGGATFSDDDPQTTQQIKDEIAEILREPTPRIELPGLSFTPLDQVKNAVDKDASGSYYIHIPYLGEYLAALYRFGVAVIIILAVIVIIVSGLQYTLSQGDQGAIGSAKDRIVKAVVGMLLALLSYVIVYIINPTLVRFDSLDILYVQGIGFASDVERNPPPQTGITSNREWYFNVLGSSEQDVQSQLVTLPNFLGRKNIPVHKHAEDAFRAVQEEVDSKLPGWKGENVWTFNWRQVKGSSTMSLHAWGIAVDVNPKTCPRYEKITRNQGIEDKCDCDIPDVVVQAFLNHGFSWLGGTGYNGGKSCDAMHFELRTMYFEKAGVSEQAAR